MNILWLSHNVPYPPVGGVVQRSYNLLKAVASKHNVYLLAFNQKPFLPTERHVDNAKAALARLCARVEVVPIPSDASRLAWYKLVLSSLVTRDPYAINWLKSSLMRLRITELVKRIRFDLVHYDTISLVEYFTDTGHLPKILNHHNIESSMMRRRAHRETNSFKKLYFAREAQKLHSVERLYASQADLNLTVSRLDSSRLQRISPYANIEVCENGTDPVYFRPDYGTPSEDGHLLFVGGLRWYPNRDAMLYFCQAVWPQLVRQAPFLKLTIVGAHAPGELLRIASGDNRIRLEGYVEDVRPYFQRADIFICPIRDGGGTRLKILDAMAMAKPIVATSIGCEGLDLIPDKDVLIADKPEDFVRHILQLRSNHTLKAELGARVRSLVEQRYSWNTIGMRLLTLYEKLLSSRTARLQCGLQELDA